VRDIVSVTAVLVFNPTIVIAYPPFTFSVKFTWSSVPTPELSSVLLEYIVELIKASGRIQSSMVPDEFNIPFRALI
jgi:hypothetical protein